MTGMSTWFDYYPESDMTVIKRMQDVGPILELNKKKANDTELTKRGFKESWWKYADIPNIIIEKWLNEDGINVYNKDHNKAVFKKLNDPEYRYLKTTAKYHR